MWDQPEKEMSHGTIIRYNIGIREFGLVLLIKLYVCISKRYDIRSEYYKILFLSS